MRPPEDQLPRCVRLQTWMRDNDVTCAILGELLGCSTSYAWRLLQSEVISTRRHRQLTVLGIPLELLPLPRESKRVRPRYGNIPDWMQKNIPKLQEV